MRQASSARRCRSRARVMASDDAIAFFKGKGEHFKAEIIDDIDPGRARSSRSTRQGEFIDLCRGPHVPNTDKLARLQADERVRRLLARRFQKNAAAAAHLRHRLVERQGAQGLPRSRSRKPRSATTARSARRWTCSTMQEEAPGLVFWHPEGLGASGRWSSSTCARSTAHTGYQEVRCPQILDVSLWKKSGHWDNYQDNMFFTESEKRDLRDQADELPGPRADLQPRPAQLPRPADPLRRVRRLPSQRAVRRAARHHARARLHPGRRPHLLHRGPDRIRSDGLPRAGA